MDAFIPSEYIVNEEQKLEIYKRIAGIENEGDRDDMRDELRDRFGELPESVDNLIRISLVREKAHALYILEIKGGNGEIAIKMNNNARLKAEKIPAFIDSCEGKISFRPASYPLFLYKYVKDNNPKQAERQLLKDVEEIVEKMEVLAEV